MILRYSIFRFDPIPSEQDFGGGGGETDNSRFDLRKIKTDNEIETNANGGKSLRKRSQSVACPKPKMTK